MKISEMEYHHGEYTSLEGKIKKMLDNREFPTIFSVCVETFPHIVPAIQYRKKREITPEMPDWTAFDVICKYAPPLFEHTVIASLFEFVKSTRLLVKQDNGFLQTIDIAFGEEEVARILLNHIEKKSGVLQEDIIRSHGNNPQTTSMIIDIWEELGIVDRRCEGGDNRIYLSLRLDEEVSGVCPSCGVIIKESKEYFLQSISCKKCGVEDYHHIKYSYSQS